MKPSDFVNVRLTDAGREFAGPNGSVRIANAHMSYQFSGDTPQRVLTSEWTKIFSTEKCQGVAPMFEIATPAPAPAAQNMPIAEEKQEK